MTDDRTKEIHLGDGLYASFDGFAITLWLGVSRPGLTWNRKHGATLKQVRPRSRLSWCSQSCAPC